VLLCVCFSTVERTSIQNEFSDECLNFCHCNPWRYEHVFLHFVSVTAEGEMDATNTSVRNTQPSVQLNIHTGVQSAKKYNNTCVRSLSVLHHHAIQGNSIIIPLYTAFSYTQFPFFGLQSINTAILVPVTLHNTQS